jgi:alpha-L-rhamnosidase
MLTVGSLVAAPTHLVDESPISISVVGPGIHLVDFGRVAFGNVRVHSPVGATVPDDVKAK